MFRPDEGTIFWLTSFSSMIVRGLNIKRVAILPTKADPIWIVDPNAVLPRSIAVEPLQTVRWWSRKIPKLRGTIDLHQSSDRDRLNLLVSLDPPLAKDRLRVFIAKGWDQTSAYNESRST